MDLNGFKLILYCKLQFERQKINVESSAPTTGIMMWEIHAKILQTEAPLSCMSMLFSRSWRIGCVAFIQSRWTLEGVSSPARVVRSMHVTAFSNQAAYNRSIKICFSWHKAIEVIMYHKYCKQFTCHCFLATLCPWICWALLRTAWVLTLTFDTHSRSKIRQE